MNRVTKFALIILLGFSFPITTFATISTRYNPTVQVDSSGGSFNGVRFQGVSAAVLNCTDLTQKAAVAIGKLTDKIKGKLTSKGEDLAGSANSVSVGDSKTHQKEEEIKSQQKSINDGNYCLQGIGSSVAKNMLSQVLNKTLTWATGGGVYGLPLFIDSPGLYLQNLTNDQVNRYLQKNNNHPLFQSSIQTLVMLSQTGVNDGRLTNLLNNSTSKRYQGFQQNFTSGGWNSFMNMGYNPVGALFTASDALERNISQAQQELDRQVIAGNGFTDVKSCKKWSSTKPAPVTDENGNLLKKVPSPYANSITAEPTCLEWETVTPGSVVASQVAATTQSEIRQLELADNYNEILGAYFDNMLNNLFQKGLKGATGSGSTIDARFGDDAYLGDLFGDKTGGIFGNVSTGGNGYAGEFDISRPQHTRLILQTQVDYLAAVQDSYIAMRHLVPVLGALDYCMPGPNPTWNSGLGGNYQSILAVISDKIDKGAWTTATENWVDFNNTVDVLGKGHIGDLVNFISGIFGGTKNDYYFFSQPTLFDKTRDDYTNAVVPIAVKYADRTSKPSLEEVTTHLNNGYASMLTYLQTLYTKENYSTAFMSATNGVATTNSTNYSPYTCTVALDGSYDCKLVDIDYTPYLNQPALPAFSAGRISDILDKTSRLIGYNQAVNELIPEYEDSIDKSKLVVDEMTDIFYGHDEYVAGKKVHIDGVSDIVSAAKARYIAENIAKKTPIKDYRDKNNVLHSCLDKTYTIDKTPIKPGKREESDAVDSMLVTSLKSNIYFYKNLMK